jgi:PilZ domain
VSNPKDQSQENRLAFRFPVHAPVRVKLPGSNSEIVYATRDVSHRGVFMLTNQPLPENSPIEFTMKLNAPGSPQDGVQVLCSGTVVRVEAPVDGDIGMAATIDSYRFLHDKKGNA